MLLCKLTAWLRYSEVCKLLLKQHMTHAAHHVRAKSFPKIVPSILQTNVACLFAIEAFGKDTDHTQVDEETDEQRQC